MDNEHSNRDVLAQFLSNADKLLLGGIAFCLVVAGAAYAYDKWTSQFDKPYKPLSDFPGYEGNEALSQAFESGSQILVGRPVVEKENSGIADTFKLTGYRTCESLGGTFEFTSGVITGGKFLARCSSGEKTIEVKPEGIRFLLPERIGGYVSQEVRIGHFAFGVASPK